ncbi:uncharacterized protein YpmB [Virgibacillus halotolerans]|uniref:cell wall elongation regulator TseB-like domain-containing protein n=1 Tax=Virgibacillus halotolerans TaxID=1071053 RepID=UPI001960E81B|nr:DUF5590 domain-containing protein [Virgibacillus halotolerans]MBM7598386.1 uncharacterized protein YpmB [Virgibacillus halotolerans]
MINNSYSPDKKRSWFFWSLIIILIILIIGFIYAVFLYYDVKGSKTEGFAETEKQILNATSITKIDKIEQFNGDEAYHVIFGKDNKDEKKIIFYPLKGKEKNLTTIKQADIVSEDQIVNDWKAQCEQCKLVKVVPALVDDKALWEITYSDESGRYVLDYLSLYDGSRYEQYRFRRMFK